MRIVGDIPHPQMKITIFKMEERFSVKFENGFYEQIFKFKLGEVSNLESLISAISDTFVNAVLLNFENLHQIKLKHFSSFLSKEMEDEFEKII